MCRARKLIVLIILKELNWLFFSHECLRVMSLPVLNIRPLIHLYLVIKPKAPGILFASNVYIKIASTELLQAGKGF